jgi:hypothetical protein
MAGSSARNGQENGRMASPKVRLTSGDISRQASVVTTMAPRSARRVRAGRRPRCGAGTAGCARPWDW